MIITNELGTPKLNTIHNCDALRLLGNMPSQSVNCIVTSPPYFGLRDYGMAGQIGLEDTPQEYVAELVKLFREAKRVLRDDGTFWLNLGDTYTGWGRGGNPPLSAYWKQGTNAGSVIENRTDVDGIPSKSLLGIPWRVAFGLQDDGWILRSDIIWHKPNPMPESVTDRPTKAHEYVFLFAKSQRYWYDADAIKEPAVNGDPNPPRGSRGNDHLNAGLRKQDELGKRTYTGFNDRYESLEYRNKRDVWTVTTKPFSGPHFATFPPDLIEPMILAGCPDKVCCKCGAPWKRDLERDSYYHEMTGDETAQKYAAVGNGHGGGGRGPNKNLGATLARTLGFKPTCDCNADTRRGVVLDPFMGSATTALVARDNGRNYIGSELNPEYVAIARERLRLPFEEREYTPPDKPLPKPVIQIGDVRLEQQVMFDDAPATA